MSIRGRDRQSGMRGGVEAPSQIQKFMWVVPGGVETVLDVVRHTGMVEGGEVVS
jgi:hypothetical protein